MELSVIENDHAEVKKYLKNFVPDNYYRVLGDAYLYQVRAVLQHAVSNPGEYNVRYDSLINTLAAQFENNRVNIGQEISAWADKQAVHAQRLTYLEAENSTVSASITELEKIIISNNKAILEKTNKLAAQLVDFEVGGVNLIHNSTFAKGYKAVGDVAITTSDHVLGTLFKIVNLADVEEEIGIGSLVEFNKIKLMEGKQYTLSFYGFGSVELINSIKLNKGDLVHTLDPIIMDSDISNRKTLTFIAPFSGDDIGFSIGTVGYPIDSWFSLVAVQLELGSRATDWSPSPFDNADYIARVAASLEEVRKITIEQQAVNVAAIDTLRANIGETKGQISNEREINLSKFSSMTRQLDELTSSTADNTSRITNLDNSYTDKFTANAEKFVELEANVGASNAAITRVDEVVATNTSAIATSTNNLSAKIDGIKIGGRNLIRNSTFKLGHEAWGDATITRKDTVLGSEVTITNNGSAQFGIQNDVLFRSISLVEGDEYTLSFYGNGNIPSINSIWLKSEGNDPQLLGEIAIDAVLAEKKVLTFTSTITADDVSIIIAAVGYPVGSWFKIVALQLEKGNKATDWTEAPEDIVNFISGVEANIDEFKEVQVGINGATATQIDTLNTKTDNSNAAIDELRETTSNIEGSTATLETKLRGEYTSAISTTRSDITQATDGKINAVKKTLSEMTTDISSKADITRVDSIENNAKQSLATARTELTSSYTSAISTAKTESATDATNKANKAKTDANTYTDGNVTTLTTLVNSKASISRVDDVENNANQALASTKTEITGEYTSAISSVKEESATDAQAKADKALADATIKATEAQTAAEAYALAEANAKAAAALDSAKSDATTKANKARADAELAAALDAKNKADEALRLAKLDATAKADAVKGMVESLTKVVDSKASISRVDSIENNATQALATAKTELTSEYTSSISKAIKDIEIGGRNHFPYVYLSDRANWAGGAYVSPKIPIQLEPNTKYTLYTERMDISVGWVVINLNGDSTEGKLIHDGTSYINNSNHSLIYLNERLEFTTKDSGKLFLSVYNSGTGKHITDIMEKAQIFKGTVLQDWTPAPEDTIGYIDSEITKVNTKVDSKADISRVDSVENNAVQSLATAKTELTSSYTSAIATAKSQSATDAQTKADKALTDAKADTLLKANAAQLAAETYALAEAKAKADAALVLANSDATTKANAAKSAAEANAALDAKNKADKALADAKLDATAKANAAKEHADTIVNTLKTVVDSKATIEQLNTVKNDANQALASTKTELTGSYTTAITVAKGESATDAQARASQALKDAKLDATGKANEAERLAKAHADTQITALTKVVDSKANISRVDSVENDAKQALATAKTELTSNYTTAINQININNTNYMPSEFLNNPENWIRGTYYKANIVVDLEPNTTYTIRIGELLPYGGHGVFNILDGTDSVRRIIRTVFNINANTIIREDINTTFITPESGKITFDIYYFGYLNPDYIKRVQINKGTAKQDWIPSFIDAELKTIANTTAITTEATARSTADTALTNLITTLDTDYKGNKTAIRNELTAVSNKADSTANSLSTLTTTVGGNTTKISQESTARSTADTALGNRITATDAIAKNAQSRVGTAETAISNANGAIATLRTDLTASYSVADTRNTNELPVYYYNGLANRVTREFKFKSVMGIPSGAGTYVYLETTVKWGGTSGGAVSQEAITDDNRIFTRTSSGNTWRAWEEQESVAGSAAKVAAAKLALDNRINTTDARVTAEKKVAADATSAVASTVNGLTTTVNGHTSSINETKTSLNGISAKWTMETNVNGKVSGIYQHSTGKSSGLDIITDRFTLSNGTTAGYAPFRQEGSTTYLNMAVIKDTSITTAKIDNLAVTAAKVGNLAVTTAKLDNLAVTRGKIASLAVDTLQIELEAVTVPRLFYYPLTRQIFFKNSHTFDYTLDPNARLSRGSKNGLPVGDILTMPLGSATFDAMGGSVSIQAFADDLVYSIPNSNQGIAEFDAVAGYCLFGLTLRRTDMAEPLREVMTVAWDVDRPQAPRSAKHNMTIPPVLDYPPSGVVTYEVFAWIYHTDRQYNRYTFKTIKNKVIISIGSVSVQIIGTKR